MKLIILLLFVTSLTLIATRKQNQRIRVGVSTFALVITLLSISFFQHQQNTWNTSTEKMFLAHAEGNYDNALIAAKARLEIAGTMFNEEHPFYQKALEDVSYLYTKKYQSSGPDVAFTVFDRAHKTASVSELKDLATVLGTTAYTTSLVSATNTIRN